jgi:hypothetical protein
MNNEKFTPGPWYLSPKKTYVRAESVHGWNIAHIEEQEPFTDANAKLIAAAPDMYDAIVKYLEAVEAGEITDQLDGLKAAIKKATE